MITSFREEKKGTKISSCVQSAAHKPECNTTEKFQCRPLNIKFRRNTAKSTGDEDWAYHYTSIQTLYAKLHTRFINPATRTTRNQFQFSGIWRRLHWYTVNNVYCAHLYVIQEVKSPARINLQGDRYSKLKRSQEMIRWWQQNWLPKYPRRETLLRQGTMHSTFQRDQPTTVINLEMTTSHTPASCTVARIPPCLIAANVAPSQLCHMITCTPCTRTWRKRAWKVCQKETMNIKNTKYLRQVIF
jgi:hypothetical protein